MVHHFSPTMGSESNVLTEKATELRRPSLYKVLLLNDDYTPMDFVVMILEQFFAKSTEDATQIMLDVHHSGAGICGLYSRDIAETKAMQVMEQARLNQHPLQCRVEKA